MARRTILHDETNETNTAMCEGAGSGSTSEGVGAGEHEAETAGGEPKATLFRLILSAN
jgi:hypothetical protein